jgi:hypothetical protein
MLWHVGCTKLLYLAAITVELFDPWHKQRLLLLAKGRPEKSDQELKGGGVVAAVVPHELEISNFFLEIIRYSTNLQYKLLVYISHKSILL